MADKVGKYDVVQKFCVCTQCGSPNVQVRRMIPPFGFCFECEQDISLREEYGTEEDTI